MTHAETYGRTLVTVVRVCDAGQQPPCQRDGAAPARRVQFPLRDSGALTEEQYARAVDRVLGS